MGEEAPELLTVGSVFHPGGLQGAVNLLGGFHQPEAAGRLRDPDSHGDGHVMDVLTGPAHPGFSGGPCHFNAPLAALGPLGGGVHDADIGRRSQLHAAYLGDGKGAAGLLVVDVLARPPVGAVLPDVELDLGDGDPLEVARYLHGGDGDQDVVLVLGVLVELDDGIFHIG